MMTAPQAPGAGDPKTSKGRNRGKGSEVGAAGAQLMGILSAVWDRKTVPQVGLGPRGEI